MSRKSGAVGGAVGAVAAADDDSCCQRGHSIKLDGPQQPSAAPSSPQPASARAGRLTWALEAS